jgi:hypothetical protein
MLQLTCNLDEGNYWFWKPMKLSDEKQQYNIGMGYICEEIIGRMSEHLVLYKKFLWYLCSTVQ